jgi:hypothetical protein
VLGEIARNALAQVGRHLHGRTAIEFGQLALDDLRGLAPVGEQPISLGSRC